MSSRDFLSILVLAAEGFTALWTINLIVIAPISSSTLSNSNCGSSISIDKHFQSRVMGKARNLEITVCDDASKP
jgi:hypothetical protein